MSKLDPKNRMEAYAHQLSDDIQMLFKFALMNDENGYDKYLEKIQNIIGAYYSTKLRKMVEATKKKTKEREAYIEKNLPWMLKK